MSALEKENWYQKKWLLILLLFLVPPMGIFGIFKRDTKTGKKIVYTILGIFTSFYLLGIVLVLFTPNANYSKGEELYNKAKYSEAILEFRKVDKEDDLYNSSIEKINLSHDKIDSIKMLEKGLILRRQKDSIKEIEIESIKMNYLKSFQKQWADSVLKSESRAGNRHFTNVVLSLPDTILFEYTKGVTENGFTTNLNIDKERYPKHYKKTLSNKLGEDFLKYKTYISFIPNQKVLSKNNPNDWSHPVMLNKGLKIYKGNTFSKTYLGVLKCKFKDEDRSVFDGNQFVVIEKIDGTLTRVLRNQLNTHYWVKKSDPNYNSARGLSKCY